MRNKTTTSVALLVFVLALTGCTSREQQPPDNNELRSSVDVGTPPTFVSNDEHSSKLWDSTKQLYTLRQFRPAWAPQNGANAAADAALQVLENASAEGLNPQEFAVAELRALRESMKVPGEAPAGNEFELRLSYSLMRYVSQLCFGRINPADIGPDWPGTEKDCDAAGIVNNALERNTVTTLAEQLSPKLPEYEGLKKTLAQYREIAAQGGWQTLPVSTNKKADLQADPALAGKLALLGDLAETNSDPQLLKEALTQFQTRHGLQPDGRLGPKTVNALNVSVEERIEQIAINMDRMRWIDGRLEPRHLRVNIPGFQLSVHDGDQIPLEMRAIVGSKENATPILDGTMEYLVFSPYWNIPLSIANKELLPQIQKSTNYLRKENIEVVRGSGDKLQVLDPSKIDWDKESDLSEYQLRQKPGATNALGLVKFIFPNSYNVYLHDTPSDNLFDRLTRTLSHGCVRVERPTELASYVLQDQPEWTMERIEEAMHAEKEKRVPLKTSLPVHLLYWTAWTDAQGKAHFREDVYGYDVKHRELTAAGRQPLPTANAAGVEMNEVGAGVVPNAAAFHGKRGLSEK